MRILEKTTVKSPKDRCEGQEFACITLFRRFVYFSLLTADTPMNAHRAWVRHRLDYLNQRRSSPYLLFDYYPEEDDEPVALDGREWMFCSTSSIREFYLHTFIAFNKPEPSKLYSVSLCAEGGIYSTQLIADSLDDAVKELRGKQKHVFDKYLSEPRGYYMLLDDFEAYRVLQDNQLGLRIASIYADENGRRIVKPSRRGKERVFSQNSYTLFIVPTIAEV